MTDAEPDGMKQPAPNECAVFVTICGTAVHLFNHFLYNTYVPWHLVIHTSDSDCRYFT